MREITQYEAKPETAEVYSKSFWDFCLLIFYLILTLKHAIQKYVKICISVPILAILVLTVSKGACAVLCLRGGRGLTWVTWRRGEPCVGRVDRHSHDAERERGADVWGVDTKGEELGSSPRPEGEWITS